MIGYTLLVLIALGVVIVGSIVVGAAVWSWRQEKQPEDSAKELT